MLSTEESYSQECIQCGQDRPLLHFGTHRVVHTTRFGDGTPKRTCYGRWNRGCDVCWANWMLAPPRPEHERPSRTCPQCGDGRGIYLGANFARCRACGWTYAFERPA